MNTALISLYDRENNAVRLLAAIARKQGHRVLEIYFKDWRNNSFTPPVDIEKNNLIRLLKDNDVKLVGISLRSSPYNRVAAEITEHIKNNLDIPVLWGGTHAILCPEECIREADYVCVGEGDETFVSLINYIQSNRPTEHMPNLWVKTDEKIIRNPVGNVTEDLDSLPYRDYETPDKYFIEGDKIETGDPMPQQMIYQMMCSRGCPFSCSFCYNSVFKSEIYKDKGNYFRLRSMDSVIDELKEAKRIFPNLKKIKFDDEVFPYEPEWVEEFCRRYPEEIGIPFECFTESKLVSEEYFKKLREAGLKIIYMGIQNTHKIARTLYDRNDPEERTLYAVNLFKKLGLDARYQVIVDDLVSTDEDREYLFNFLMKFPRPFALYLFSMTVYPHTVLARKLLDMGKITPDDIEGAATKTFEQHRVDVNYPRPPDEKFWICMLVLMTKPFIPKSFLNFLSKNKLLRAHPWPLQVFAQAANFIHMGWFAGKMLLKGEMSPAFFKRWANPRSWITQ
ncbi:MAG: cobalamin-dependent protein [Chloroflexi bacterium]|nr:cobalamin-dependent protein [Chloroflexota bacterium]